MRWKAKDRVPSNKGRLMTRKTTCSQPGCSSPRLSYHNRCREHHLEYQKKWQVKHPESNRASGARRKAAITEILLAAKNVPCADCGIKYQTCVMDFHHMGDKEFEIATARQRRFSPERVRKEIAKCVVLCSNCHRIRHDQESTNGRSHHSE
jgi:hypothetical protein